MRRRAMSDSEGVPVLAGLKTDRSRRTLVKPAAVASALRALRTQQAADRLRLGSAYEDQDIVFLPGRWQPVAAPARL
jgi:hypothetical protein